ncbi:hypothetical protein ACFQZI_14710 [Mucilaginibacter lutimaris]|uniref:SPW repeat-containing protein n=1 Tax=Mucilaginibacter lutimaris TaxID=931629 RepID=A0ABW2ZJ28_9SPHI
MSRLFYEPQKTVIAGADGTDEPNVQGKQLADYLEKVSKLIPSEIIGAYLTMVGLLTKIDDHSTRRTLTIVVFFACLLLTPIYLYRMADADKPKIIHILLSTFAFIVWAYVTSGDKIGTLLGWNGYDAAAASIFLILFSIISALIPLKK